MTSRSSSVSQTALLQEDIWELCLYLEMANEPAVLSGDTVIIRPKELPEKGKPAKERYDHVLLQRTHRSNLRRDLQG